MSVVENFETLQQNGGHYEVARFNALRHGLLSQYTILPWEDGEEYEALLAALVAEHKPRGPTEEHFVEELVGVIWRKRRLRLGESAAHHRALRRATDIHQDTAKAALVHIAADVPVASVSDAIHSSEAQTAEDRADLESDQTMTEKDFGERGALSLFARAGRGARGYPDMVGGATRLECTGLRGGPDTLWGRRREPQALPRSRDFALVREASARA